MIIIHKIRHSNPHTEEEGRRRTHENPMRQRGGGEEEGIFVLAMEFGIFGYHGTVLESF